MPATSPRQQRTPITSLDDIDLARHVIRPPIQLDDRGEGPLILALQSERHGGHTMPPLIQGGWQLHPPLSARVPDECIYIVTVNVRTLQYPHLAHNSTVLHIPLIPTHCASATPSKGIRAGLGERHKLDAVDDRGVPGKCGC